MGSTIAGVARVVVVSFLIPGAVRDRVRGWESAETNVKHTSRRDKANLVMELILLGVLLSGCGARSERLTPHDVRDGSIAVFV